MRVALLALVAVLPACDKIFTFDKNVQVDAPPVIEAKWISVSAGAGHTCATQTTGALWCWGKNDDGQLGIGTIIDVNAPVRIGTDSWRSVAAGAGYTCGIKTDGSLWCWGGNDSGQLGIGNRERNSTPARVGTETDWRSIAAGSRHTCGIRESEDSLWCWGSNQSGALGTQEPGAKQSPERISPTIAWATVATSIDHTCAITKSEGALYCWGTNDEDDQLGLDLPTTIIQVPTRVGADTEWTMLATRGGEDRTHSCGVRAGMAYCWGANNAGQAGNSTTTATPTLLDQAYVSISAGGQHTCGILADGALHCWGRNERGELGIGSETAADYNTPQLVSGTWASVSAGVTHTCAIDLEGVLHCTGTNVRGELGDGAGGPRSLPVLVGGGYQLLALGTTHACAAGTAKFDCWGANGGAQLGDGSRAPRRVPAPSGPFAGATEIATGHDQTCVLVGQTLSCWGGNAAGSVGDGNPNTIVTSPTVIAPRAGKVWLSIGAGQHTCATDSDGVTSGYCWGENAFGELGTGNTNARSTPTALSGSGLYTAIVPGGNHTCGLRTAGSTGEVWCWGSNTQGQIGDATNGSTFNRTSPVATHTTAAASPPLRATAIALGELHTCAVGVDAKLYCWGQNGRSQLGDGTSAAKNFPQPIGDGYVTVATGDRHSCAIRTDGALACWGDNTAGQLGDGSFVVKTTPSPIASSLKWKVVRARKDYTCALTDADELYCWGRGDLGQLGIPNAWQTSFAPVVPTP